VGLADVTVPEPVTVKTPVPVPVDESVLVTVTLLAPRVAVGAVVMLAVSLVALTYAYELTVIPAPENVATAPVSNPVPVIVTAWPLWFCANEDGDTEVTVGAAATVKTPAPVPVPVSVLVTVTLLAPSVAPPEIVTLAVSLVALTYAYELTVIPAPEKVATAPAANPVPVIVTV
jgi:hypothetical protein